MKKKNLHEGCIEQAYRLFSEKLTPNVLVDKTGRIRLDDLEMLPEVQKEVEKIWKEVTTNNLEDLVDIKGYRKDFLNMFGFLFENIDYEEDVEIDLKIKSLNFESN